MLRELPKCFRTPTWTYGSNVLKVSDEQRIGMSEAVLGQAQSAGRSQAFRGEDIELVSRELGVPAAEVSEWRDTFLEGGESVLKPRPAGEGVEVDRLQSKIGEQAMEIKLLREKIARMEQNRPVAHRRSRK